MSPRSWLVSALLTGHLVAIAGAAVPPPDAGRTPGPEAAGSGSPVWVLLEKAHRAAWRWSGAWRRLGRAYTSRLALPQNWNMFANPGDTAQYIRVRHFVTPGGVASELILPAHREDQVRLAKGLRDSFRDKTVSTAFERFVVESERRFRQARRDKGLDPARATALVARNLPSDLVPVVRFFGDRFARAHLSAGERIVRQEVWYGRAPLATDGGARPERMEVLQRYYRGAIFGPPGQDTAAARFGDTEREADIVWTLFYVHEP
jgi:hypothetical protein